MSERCHLYSKGWQVSLRAKIEFIIILYFGNFVLFQLVSHNIRTMWRAHSPKWYNIIDLVLVYSNNSVRNGFGIWNFQCDNYSLLISILPIPLVSSLFRCVGTKPNISKLDFKKINFIDEHYKWQRTVSFVW